MSQQDVVRDERTIATENASYRLATLFMSFGLLLDVAWRSFHLGEAPWDLMALIVLGGVVSSVYQGSHHVLTWRWAKLTVASALLAILVAVLLVLLR